MLSLLPRAATLALLLGLVSACGSENTKLMVTGIEPDKGDAEGGSYVRIRGNRFTADGPRNAFRALPLGALCRASSSCAIHRSVRGHAFIAR